MKLRAILLAVLFWAAVAGAYSLSLWLGLKPSVAAVGTGPPLCLGCITGTVDGTGGTSTSGGATGGASASESTLMRTGAVFSLSADNTQSSSFIRIYNAGTTDGTATIMVW